MVMTVTLSEQDSAVVRTLAEKSGKNHSEILHEAIRKYVAEFQLEYIVNSTTESLSDEELTLAAELTFLELDADEVENTYA
jgi:hypothetical protein